MIDIKICISVGAKPNSNEFAARIQCDNILISQSINEKEIDIEPILHKLVSALVSARMAEKVTREFLQKTS